MDFMQAALVVVLLNESGVDVGFDGAVEANREGDGVEIGEKKDEGGDEGGDGEDGEEGAGGDVVEENVGRISGQE
ncbi:hypothetical protein KS4_08890 [Poriferisphaera corsica]|uniref:Uncharacterized protein n=1 Tax=Poriferisphaera corsica TaxID=2528020 RepID=A0A517YRJ7_9BACT|nr:hypothetical protein KS4_08890 [Poriferisphaera corsica]